MRFVFLLCCLMVSSWSVANQPEKRMFDLVNEPIDVVFVAHQKDQKTLDACIDGILENCHNVGKIYVVSMFRLTNKAEWVNEGIFPFSKFDICYTICRGNRTNAQKLLNAKSHGGGWYFQQLLKLYSPFVIPGISSNVLVVDADTIFMNPVTFVNEATNGGFFCTSKLEAKQKYIDHAARLVPGYQRIYPNVYSVCHHMLFQRAILTDLFDTVEKFHQVPFWVAFCQCVDPEGRKGASEYEIYYNYALRNSSQVSLRPLKWKNSPDLSEMPRCKEEGFHFVSFHTYMRDKKQ